MIDKIQERTPLLQTVFDKAFPTDLDECQAMLRVNNDKIREIRVNTKSVEEYENREQKIELMKKELEELQQWSVESITHREHTTVLVSTIARKEKDFLETLDRLIGKLNVSFSLYMDNIQCKGTVELINEDSFNMTGLDIKVSFRDDQDLQSLNGMVQSGGVSLLLIGNVQEKSLSTILFLLSLQEMVSFPFRFIDEVRMHDLIEYRSIRIWTSVMNAM